MYTKKPSPIIRKKKTDSEKEQDLYQYCLSFISIRPRSEEEVKKKITKYSSLRDYSDNTKQRVIQTLKEEGLIDDLKFIEWWVRQRSSFKPKGQMVLTRELLGKGVASEKIKDYFNNQPLDEHKLAYKTLLNKKKYFSGFEGFSKKKKAIDYLLRRGFSWQVSKNVFEEIFNIS